MTISGSLELGTEVEKQSVEVANPQTSESWKQPVHEKISAGSCAVCMYDCTRATAHAIEQFIEIVGS